MGVPGASAHKAGGRRSGASSRLTREAWVDAALTAIAEGGLSAVAVEPVAAGLGATKGSFYWHFANREDLIHAALRAWEQRHTEDVIAELDAEPDPGARLRTLFLRAFGGMAEGSVDAALLADAPSPIVAPVMERVTLRRLGYLERTYAELGLPPPQARSRALLAYTTWLGVFSLHRAAPGAVSGDDLITAVEPLLSPHQPPDRAH
jgi:AcrR family transcriptional regulator